MFARIVLGGAALLMAAVLAYVGVLADQFLTGGTRTGLFLGLPAAGLGAALVALRLPAGPRTVAALVVLAGGLAVYGAELYLAFAPAEEAAPPGADTRTKYEVVRDMRAAGREVYPSVFPAYLLKTGLDGRLRSPLSLGGREVLPLGGVPDVPTVLCNEAGRYVFFRSDAFGFNNPPEAWRAAPVRVAALGDSFVQGYCVPHEENFVARIGRAFPTTVNLGVSGDGPLLMLATLKEYLPALRPKAVLWFFFEGNDLPGDLAVEKRSPLLMRYLQGPAGQNLVRRRAEVGRILRRHVDRLIAARDRRRETDAGPFQTAISLIGLARLRQALRLPSALDYPDYPLFARILAEAQRTVAAWGGRLYLVYLPDFCTATRVCAGKDAARRLAAIHRRLAARAAAAGIPFVDLRPAFRDHPAPRTLYTRRTGGHYNAAGHALVAAAVIQRLGADVPAGARAGVP